MPYPAQVTREQIVERAAALIEAEGLDQLSLHGLAAAFGIKAPSLYRHVAGKHDLLRLVNERTVAALIAVLREAGEPDVATEARLLAMARAYREFAHEYPATYQLAFNTTVAEARPDPAWLEQLVLPVQAVVADLVGEARSLAALRGLFALLHGFVTLELNGQFQRGGDLGAAFESSLRAYLAGWR